MGEVIECSQPDETNQNGGCSDPNLMLERVQGVPGGLSPFFYCLPDS